MYKRRVCVCARQQVLPAKECAMRFKTDWTRKLYQDIPRICDVFGSDSHLKCSLLSEKQKMMRCLTIWLFNIAMENHHLY